MTTVLTTLKELHGLQLELADAHDQLRRLPQQLEGRKNDLAKKRAQLDENRAALKRFRMRADERELSLKSGEQKVEGYKLKLNQCKSNKEYTALQEEIKHFQEANGTLEEEILELMTEQENMAAEIAEEEKLLAAAAEEFEKFKEVTEYKTQKFTDRLEILEKKIAELEGNLDSGTRAEYRRLVKMRGPDALASCENGICSACYTSQTPQTLNDLLMGRIIQCKSCGAMLYTA